MVCFLIISKSRFKSKKKSAKVANKNDEDPANQTERERMSGVENNIPDEENKESRGKFICFNY